MNQTGRPKSLPQLTEQQMTILRFYLRIHLEEQKAPSASRASKALGIHQDQIYDQLSLIEKKGWLRKEPRKHGVVHFSSQAIRVITGRSPQRLKFGNVVKEVISELDK